MTLLFWSGPCIPSVGGFEDILDRINGSEFVRVGLDPQSGVKAEREKVVDDLKSKYPDINIDHSCLVTDLYSLVGASSPATSTRQPN